jgi:DNA (cytosine-5)-methyltransferase 1
MRCIELCAGDGGGLLANLILGHTTICAVEREPHCQAVLRARQTQGFLPEFPIHDDVRRFDGRPWRGAVDVLSGGIPCQGFSGAGKGLGEFDPRNLWPDALRILKECRAPWFFLENVDRLTSFDYWGVILQDLATAGYDARWCVFSAGDVGAPHLRKRIWLLATDTKNFLPACPMATGGSGVVADAMLSGLPQREPIAGSIRACAINEEQPAASGTTWWSTQPDLGRVADGMANRLDRPGWWAVERGLPRVAGKQPHRADRLRGCGNGQVPLCKAVAWKLLGGP